jgi:hypothetical protein
LDQFSQKLSQIQIAANITVRLKRKLKKEMNNYYNHDDENYDENVKYSARKVNKNVKLGNLNKFLKSIQATIMYSKYTIAKWNRLTPIKVKVLKKLERTYRGEHKLKL